jgi:hypothetical protein
MLLPLAKVGIFTCSPPSEIRVQHTVLPPDKIQCFVFIRNIRHTSMYWYALIINSLHAILQTASVV